MISWLSCKKYSQRSSRRIDGELKPFELPGYWFHHLICFTCRRMTRHFGIIDSASKCLGHCIEEELSASDGETLSQDKSKEIQAMLEKMDASD